MKYPTDLNDWQWALVAEFTRRPDPRGAIRRHDMRLIRNVILCVSKTAGGSGCCPWIFLYGRLFITTSGGCGSVGRGR